MQVPRIHGMSVSEWRSNSDSDMRYRRRSSLHRRRDDEAREVNRSEEAMLSRFLNEAHKR